MGDKGSNTASGSDGLEFINTNGDIKIDFKVDYSLTRRTLYEHAKDTFSSFGPTDCKGMDKLVYTKIRNSGGLQRCEKFEIEILKKYEFEAEKFGRFFKKRHAFETGNREKTAFTMDAQIFTDYFSFFKHNNDKKSFAKDCKTGKVREIDGQNWPLQMNGIKIPQYYQDVPGDGNCGYYSLICSILKSKDSKKILSEDFFNLSKIQESYDISNPLFRYLDFFRIIAFISLHKADNFEDLSRYQLYDITFYLKILIHLELSLKKQKDLLNHYKTSETTVNPEIQSIFKQPFRFISEDFGFVILSRLLNIEIISLSYSTNRDIEKYLKYETSGLNKDKHVVFIYKKNIHFYALHTPS